MNKIWSLAKKNKIINNGKQHKVKPPKNYFCTIKINIVFCVEDIIAVLIFYCHNNYIILNFIKTTG